MTTYFTNVFVTKEVEDDNYYEGCMGNTRLLHTEKVSFEFENTTDLIDKFAHHLARYWGVDIDDVRECMNNECDNYRFDFSQVEDIDGNATELSEDNPNGFYATYMFMVDSVSELVDNFEFEEVVR